jgi:hypothetical protein
MTQSWQKQPGALKPTSVTFTGTVSCASVPSSLAVMGSIQVFDVAEEAATGFEAAPVVTADAALGASDSPQSFTIRRTLTVGPGQDYEFEFLVSFVDQPGTVHIPVSGAPPQCVRQQGEPSGIGPQVPPSVDCQFVEDVATL